MFCGNKTNGQATPLLANAQTDVLWRLVELPKDKNYQ